jgi:hypothetical protein
MYKKLRLANSRRFEKELCSKSNPFTKMVCYLYKKRDYLHKVANKAAEKWSNLPNLDNSKIDYDHLVSLIPEEYTLKG